MTAQGFFSSPTTVPSAVANISPPRMSPQISPSGACLNQVTLDQQAQGLYGTWRAVVEVVFPEPAIASRKDWLDPEERQAYMEATVEQDIAYQISSNRRSRKLSQRDLAEKLGTRQSAVARLEDPTYGKHSIASLVKVAHALDCALRVTLISYSKLAEEVMDTSDAALYVTPFSHERHLIK